MSDVAAWLDRLGLAKYAPVFAENDVDLETLQHLSEADLRELGLPLGARKKILQAGAPPSNQRATDSAAAAKSGDAARRTEPERRQITVMFADIVGSTSLAERMDIEDLRSILLAYQQACTTAIEQYGGHVAQYLGDGVLAYFGYPRAHEDDAVRVVRAALTILAEMRGRNAELFAQHGVGVDVRISAHTGVVVAGEMGTGEARERLAVGETPNIAARIQNLAEPGTLVVSDATWKLVEGLFTSTPLGPQALKGIGQLVSLYRIDSATGVTNRFDALAAARSLTPLVSREAELIWLEKHWQVATEGEGQVILVQGEPGIGKSRLIRSFRDRLRNTEHRLIMLACSSQHQASPFYPVIEQLGRALDLQATDTSVARHQKLHSFLRSVGLAADRRAAPLAHLLGIPMDEPLTSDPDQIRRLTVNALVDIVIAMSAEQSLLFVVEDLHWIDPSTHELLGHLVDRIKERSVLMVLTARPEYRAPWVGLGQFSNLSLSRLSRRETEAMIRQVAGSGFTPEVMVQLVNRTDGVPLFIEELTKTVLEARSGSTVRADAVPATLQEALTARLDRLAPVREVIQVAALLGRVFDGDIVEAATGLGTEALQHALDDLVAAGLVYRRTHSAEAFEFKHALVQEAALTTLVRQRKRFLHGRIAAALRNRRPELTERQPEVIAHHLQEAGEDRAACELWRIAGEQATKRSASREAVDHFTRATECLKRLELGIITAEEEAELYLWLARALMRAEGYRAAKLAVTAESARDSAARAGSHSLLARIVLQTAPVFFSTGRNSELLAALAPLELTGADDSNLWIRTGLLVARGIAHLNRGEYIAADTLLERASSLSDSLASGSTGVALGEGDVRVVVRSYIVQCRGALGQLGQALSAGIEAEKIGRSLSDDDLFSRAWSLSVRANAYYTVGDYRATLADAEEVVALCREHGFSARLGNGLMRRGFARAKLGDLEGGIDDFRQGRALWRRSDVVFHAAQHATQLCTLLIKANELVEAGAVMDDVDDLVRGTDEAAYLAECQRIRGVIAFRQGDGASAGRWLELAVETSRNQSALLFELRATTHLADLLATQGHEPEAARRLGLVYRRFTEAHEAEDLASAKKLLDRLEQR